MSTVELIVGDSSRPLKRQRLDPSPPRTTTTENAPLPTPILLLSLPSLLLHPPNHKCHAQSLFLSLSALRRCLKIPNLDADIEFRANTDISELGMIMIAGGMDVEGLEGEIEKAISKALVISQKHPHLRLFKPHLTVLSARLARYQNNHRFAQNILRRLLSSFFTPSDPPYLLYSIHLGLIESLSASVDTRKSIHAIGDLHDLAVKNGHADMVTLSLVLKLRTFMQLGSWDEMSDVLMKAEEQLGLDVQLSNTPATQQSTQSQASTNGTTESQPAQIIQKRTKIEVALLINLIFISVIFHTYAGDALLAAARLRVLHELLDGGALGKYGETGIVEIPLGDHTTPLPVQLTHPRIIYTLAFLISSIAKRDPVGRKPKRKLFAAEGLAVLKRGEGKSVAFPVWANVEDMRQVDQGMDRMKADLVCELVGVSVMRSEFDEAERALATLTAHLRTTHLFPSYSARLTLHHAHLAHAQGDTERALECYRVAAYLSRNRDGKGGEGAKGIRKRKRESGAGSTEEQLAAGEEGGGEEGSEDPWVNASARAGEVLVRIGLFRAGAQSTPETKHEETKREYEMAQLRTLGIEVAKDCDALGGTLNGVAELLRACLTTEILKSKSHLRNALNFATSAQDNHFRALILSLIGSHYLHTSAEHAQTMLGTAEQLAAGLGAQSKSAGKSTFAGGKGSSMKENGKPLNAVGNAQLRLWIGERFLDMHTWAGEEKKAQKQAAVNDMLREAVDRIEKRKRLE